MGTLGALLLGIRHGTLKTFAILAASGVGFVAWGIWGMGVTTPRRFAAEVAVGLVVGAIIGTVLSARVRRERSRT